MRLLTALFLTLISCSLFAQLDSRERAVTAYLEDYNSQRAVRDWAVTEQSDVVLYVEDNFGLVALIDNGQTRIELDRSVSDPMDDLFPLHLKQATVVLTNATILFIDAHENNHVGFTLLDEPQVPELPDSYIMLFVGEGIGRHAVTEQ